MTKRKQYDSVADLLADNPSNDVLRKWVWMLWEKRQALHARVLLLEHEADCYWCDICSPGEWVRGQCDKCKELYAAVEVAEARCRAGVGEVK